MLNRYKQFLEIFDEHIKELFEEQKKYIKCKRGCSFCCEHGNYPFSRLEMEYIMSGYIKLPNDIKDIIRKNLSNIKNKEDYICPFLINNLCSLYQYRALTCRIHGLAYLSNKKLKMPECVNIGLNYSNVYQKQTKEVIIKNPITENLRIDEIFGLEIAKKFNLEKGEIRKLIDWFSEDKI